MKPEQWFQLWMTLLEVVGVVGGVYLAAVLTLSHERRRTEREALAVVRVDLKRTGFACQMLAMITDNPEAEDGFGSGFVEDQKQALLGGIERIDAMLPRVRSRMRTVLDEFTKATATVCLGTRLGSAEAFSAGLRALSTRADQVIAVIDNTSEAKSLRQWDRSSIDALEAALIGSPATAGWQPKAGASGAE